MMWSYEPGQQGAAGLRALSRFAAFILAAAFILIAASPAHSQSPVGQAAKSRAETLTNSLHALNARFQQALFGERSQLQAELAGIAAERQALLASLIETDPATVLQLAIPPEMRAGLPAEVQALVEEHTEIDGELEVRYEDHEEAGHLRHFLNANGRRYTVHFSGHAPDVLSGAQVRIKGVRLETALLLDSGSGTTAMLVTSPALSNTFGDQRTVVLLVNFQDNLTQPYTSTQAWDTVFGSVSNYMREASFQQTSLSGNVYGWYTLPIASTCDGYAISTNAKSAAAARGVDLSAYKRFIYVFPRNSTCGWSGMGTVGGYPSETWVNGNMTTKVVGHELGHNFGLYHAHALECGATTLGTSCTNIDYGDSLDIMGNTNAAHFSAFAKERLGWLNYGASPPITTVQSGGTFSIEPYETASSGPKALKVLKSVDPTTGYKSWYYVEYRQAIGFDGFLAGNANVLNGIVIRSGADAAPSSSFLLDITPNSALSDWNDPALTAGKSFTDSTSGVTITAQSAGGAVAGVSVSYGTQTCARANPTLTLSPGQSASVAPGTPVSYTMTVTNKDSSGCSSSQFNLGASVPAGWSASLASATLNLAPGASASTTLVVTSSASAVAGVYNVNATATNGALTSYTVLATATYVVATTTTTSQPPVAVNDSAAAAMGTSAKIAVLANDYDPAGKPLAVQSVGRASHGKVVVNVDGTVTYSPSRKYKGTDSFTYTISNGSKSASATVAVQVQ